MNNAPTISPWRLTAALFAALLLSAGASVPNYKLGDVVTQDVVTPVALSVVNPTATEELRKKEALKVPPVVRFRAETADEAEASLRAAFTQAHTNFTDALHRTMKGKPESERRIGGPLFKRAVESARRTGERFPLLDQLAPVWARDESDAAIQDALALKLRAALSQPILADKAPPIINSRNSIRLVPVTHFDQQPTPEEVERLGRNIKGSQLSSLAAARSVLVKTFSTNEQAVARFVGRFVTNNAQVDVALTQLLRARRVEGLTVMDDYPAASVLLAKGQIVDAQALSALTIMREKSLIGTLQTQLVQEQSVAAQTTRWNRWLVGGLAALDGLSIITLWRVRTRRSEVALPAVITATSNPAELAWRERAMLAEARAEQAQQAVRSGVMQWMRERLVQGLFQQRKALLSTQQHAEAEMHALEQRLEQVQAPLQERIAAYEKRITELERELSAKGEENRELIKAKIQLARHQLAAERERSQQFANN